jgi:hypothetical protein
MITKDIAFLWDLMLHPGKASKRSMDVEKALKLYYTLSIIPFILYLVFGLLLSTYGSIAAVRYFPVMHLPLLASQSALAVVVSAILFFFVLVPIGIAIDAFIYQIIGRTLLNAWNGDFARTFTAVTYAVLPVMFFYWLLWLPVLDGLYLLVVPIWALVILIISLSVQQKVRRTEAAIVAVLSWIFKLLLVVLLASSVLVAVASVISTLAGPYVPGLTSSTPSIIGAYP